MGSKVYQRVNAITRIRQGSSGPLKKLTCLYERKALKALLIDLKELLDELEGLFPI